MDLPASWRKPGATRRIITRLRLDIVLKRNHHNGALTCLKSPTADLFVQQLTTKKSSKVRNGPLWWESTWPWPAEGFSSQRAYFYGPLARYVKLLVAHAPGMPGTFSRPPRVSDPNMHHGMTHVPWFMPGSLTSGFLWNRWREKRSRYSRCMRNPQFYVSVERPIPWRHRECKNIWWYLSKLLSSTLLRYF